MTDPSTSDASELLRQLPSVDALLQQRAIASLLDEYPRGELVACIREVLGSLRADLRAHRAPDVSPPALALAVREHIYERTRPRLRRVINATGIVLHTGMGRAPLATEALEAIHQTAAGYCNLEVDLETGQRGSRHDHLRELLRELTGAEDAIVVNNNAAATYLTLNSLAAGADVVVSRGQLVEIGGSYRMPDIMAAAGCRMVEVGATNRTSVRDYERALNEQTSVLLHVHTSNYRIVGFVSSPSVADLVKLARNQRGRGPVVVDDLGSGLLSRQSPAPRPPANADEAPPERDFMAAWDEPTVHESIAAGADVTLFSGDKLLGGPQAGVIVGRAALIRRLLENPLARTFRPGKLTLAALEATLRLYRDPASLAQRLPAMRLLSADLPRLQSAADRLTRLIRERVQHVQVDCVVDQSYAGGGSLPTIPFDTWVVRVRVPGVQAGRLAAALRREEAPVVCRVQDDALVLDCRTLMDDDVEQIPGSLSDALRELCNLPE